MHPFCFALSCLETSQNLGRKKNAWICEEKRSVGLNAQGLVCVGAQ